MCNYIVLTFHNTHGALRCERVLESAGMPVKVIPMPAEIGSDCALCVRLPEEELSEALALLDGAEVKYKDIYRQDGGAFTKA
ncbi:MAG: DUF3343 domain-containing protein [Oscillospiraceae bacterium]|nr:DUF3343 domain-containing protein [Oscillospiraceae bacterium]